MQLKLTFFLVFFFFGFFVSAYQTVDCFVSTIQFQPLKEGTDEVNKSVIQKEPILTKFECLCDFNIISFLLIDPLYRWSELD